jgi:hypothetical protein
MCIIVKFDIRKGTLLWQDCNTLTVGTAGRELGRIKGPILSKRVGLAFMLFALICDVLGLSLGQGTA